MRKRQRQGKKGKKINPKTEIGREKKRKGGLMWVE